MMIFWKSGGWDWRFPIFQALGCCLCLRGKPLETWLGTTPLEWKVLFVRALLAYSVLCHLDKFRKIGNEQLAVVISCFSTCFGSCSCFVQHVSNLVAKRWDWFLPGWSWLTRFRVCKSWRWGFSFTSIALMPLAVPWSTRERDFDFLLE